MFMSTTTDAPPATPDVVEALLASVDVRLRRQVRLAASAGEAVPLERGALSLVYVIEGTVGATGHGIRSTLEAGDALLASGSSEISLGASGRVRMLVSTLSLADRAAHLADVLPATAIVRGFDRLEPAAAVLAAQLGIDLETTPETPQLSQPGDSVVCRMMANAVLVSVIRAWAAHGCAPVGWPSRSSDPYLDRVIEAIHAAPGREWSVAGLASVGAMSRSVFAQRFRAAFGVSPASYVTEVRMRTAQDLLAGGRGVGDVSRTLGYGSEDGFSRAFRRSTGQTPSAWRAAQLV